MDILQVRDELLQSLKEFESVGADIIEHSSLVLSEVVGRVDEVPIDGLVSLRMQESFIKTNNRHFWLINKAPLSTAAAPFRSAHHKIMMKASNAMFPCPQPSAPLISTINAQLPNFVRQTF